MAVSSGTELKIKVKVDGEKNLDRLSRQLGNIGKDTVSSNFKFDKFTASLRKQQQESTRSVSNLRAFAGAWRELANSVDYTSAQFREANFEAQKLERQLAKTQRSGRGGSKAGGALAAIGSAGLLGPEALAGAAIGTAFGAPLVGAAIGSTVVAPVRRATAGIAEGVADINRFRIALAGVSDDLKDYEKSTQAIAQATKDFLLPIDSATQQYTRLQASVKGAGFGTEETTKVFRGISAAIIATGGSTEDLNSALRATSQVFSKGKVSAEELRQQIGERLPGAFTIFAQSLDKTPQQLDKALEKGEVTLEDFLTFSEELFDRYGASAEVLASAPENAGKRLEVALRNAQDNYGFFFQKLGARLQDNTTQFVNWFNKNSETIKQFVTDSINNLIKIGEVAAKIGKGVADSMMQVFRPVITIIKVIAPAALAVLKKVGDQFKQGLIYQGIAGVMNAPGRYSVEDLFGPGGPTQFGTGLGRQTELPTADTADTGAGKGKTARSRMTTTSAELLKIAQLRLDAQRDNNELLVAQLDYESRLQQITERFNANEIDFNTAKIQDLENQGNLQDKILRLRQQEKSELAKLSKDQKEVNKQLTESQQLAKSVVETFATGMGDAFINLFEQAKSLRDIFADLLRQTARLILNFGLQAATKGLFPQLFPQAMGGIMTSNGPLPLKRYASGGIATSPQLAMFGEGSMPEAYVPLPDGRSIPVKIKGNGAGESNIVVNVDAGNSNVQGNGTQANQLGKAIGAAVQAELIKQKKPGGLLA